MTNNTVINEIKQLARVADADVIMIDVKGDLIVYHLPKNSSEMRLFLGEIIDAQWKDDANDADLIARKFELFVKYQGFDMEECSITFYVKVRKAS